ncbi:MAG: hypothetical protein WC929_07795 [Bacilli bacterium]|jgi:hypothetical protein
MTTISKLLDELREIDPGIWNPITWQIKYTCGKENTFLIDSIIQSHIQRACESRGWTWNICKQTPEHEKSHSAYISEVAPGYDGDYRNQYHEYCIAEKEANFSAEALLATYIAAVKMKQITSKKQYKKCGDFYMDTTIDSSKTKGNKINELIY